MHATQIDAVLYTHIGDQVDIVLTDFTCGRTHTHTRTQNATIQISYKLLYLQACFLVAFGFCCLA